MALTEMVLARAAPVAGASEARRVRGRGRLLGTRTRRPCVPESSRAYDGEEVETAGSVELGDTEELVRGN